MNNPEPNERRLLNWPKSLAWAAAAIASFHLAYASSRTSFCILLFLFSLFQLRNLGSSRKAFYFGLTMGFAIYAPQLNFFWKLFGPAAIVLWLVLAFWLGLFLLLAQLATSRFGEMKGALLIPFLWTGLEYFRSELYYLKFSWMNAGYAFSSSFNLYAVGWLGVYGIGFVLMSVASAISFIRPRHWAIGGFGAAVVALMLLNAPHRPTYPPTKWEHLKFLHVAGIQMEFPSEKAVLQGLDKVLQEHPKTDLFLLSEYTFLEPIPQSVRQWCKTNRRHLIVGGKEPAGDTNFYNTAFVIGPDGGIVFQQAKSVPIQFFKDGLPAKEQKVWASPWGKIGICICYDFSYRRVADELVRQGAQALIVPMMDVVDWGKYQHLLHSRIGPMRAAEFNLPVVRLASSGISQIVNRRGWVEHTASFPGEDEILAGKIVLTEPPFEPARLPMDHWFAPFTVFVTGLFVLWLCFNRLKKTKSNP